MIQISHVVNINEGITKPVKQNNAINCKLIIYYITMFLQATISVS